MGRGEGVDGTGRVLRGGRRVEEGFHCGMGGDRRGY